MQRSFRLIWDRLQTTLWFIPTLLALGGVAAALALIDVDLQIDPDSKSWMTFFQIGATGVRQVLAVTTGAMMTITGVVFSISVVTLTLAANQFGAKILRNYLSDSRNKVVLGLFVGSFLYGLVVLASIDSASDSRIPALAFMISLLLTLAAIAALIYFINNISTSIQADIVIAEIGKNLAASVEHNLPSGIALEEAEARSRWEIATHAAPRSDVLAPKSGYVEYIDYEALLEHSHRAGYHIEIHARAGDFIVKGNPLATIYSDTDTQRDAAVERHISLGTQRTNVQDLEYAIMQLLQIAQRALSPGINDSLTAIACIDWFCAALAQMSRHRFQPGYQLDPDGTVRLKLHPFDFAGAANAVFNPLRQNSRDNEMVTIRLLDGIASIMRVARHADYLKLLHKHAGLVYEHVGKTFPDDPDVADIASRYALCESLFQERLREVRAGGPQPESQ